LRIELDAEIPPDRARRILFAAALDAGRELPALAPDVVLHELAEGAAIYLLRFHVADYSREAACRDAVAEAVLRALHHAGIDLARPIHELRLMPAAEAPKREALLRRLPLFRDFPAAEQQELARSMRHHNALPGASIIREGEAGESLFLLAEGALEVRVRGVDVPIDLLLPGAVFGEMSLLTGQPRSRTVLAATGAEFFEIAREHLDPILRRQPELAEGLAAMMAARQAHNAEDRRSTGPADPVPLPDSDLLERLRAFFNLSPG